jgi:hypothetical protein
MPAQKAVYRKVMNLACNCGNFSIEWETKLNAHVARTCGCDYCLSQQGEFVSDSSSTVKYTVFEKPLYQIIQHGHNTASFHECKNCGVIVVTSEIGKETYCVLNAKALGLAGYSLDPVVKDYSAESVQDRLARRKKYWCKVLMRIES